MMEYKNLYTPKANFTTRDTTDKFDFALQSKLHSLDFTLDDFDIGAFIGDGAHGQVFLARERRTGFICVLKCILKAQLVKNGQEAIFKREIELHGHLRHPNIACLYTWFTTSTMIFIVMEYCHNGDLFNYLSTKGQLTEQRVSEILFEVIWAIRSCHDKRIAHLDIKPENILLDHENRCKLADFGFSAHIGDLYRSNGVPYHRGTHDYWSPEQCAKHLGLGSKFGEYNEQSDIWALGVLAVELYIGYPPFGSTTEDSNQAVMDRIHSYHWTRHLFEMKKEKHLVSCSHEFRSFVEACLRKQSFARPTAEQLLLHPWIVKHNLNKLKDNGFNSQPRSGYNYNRINQLKFQSAIL